MDFNAYLQRVATLETTWDHPQGPLTMAASDNVPALFQAFATQFAQDASTLV